MSLEEASGEKESWHKSLQPEKKPLQLEEKPIQLEEKPLQLEQKPPLQLSG